MTVFCCRNIQIQVAAGSIVAVRACFYAAANGNFRLGFSRVFFQLVNVDRVSSVFARSYVDDLVACHVNLVFREGRAFVDGQAIVVDDGVAHGHAAIRGQVDILIQFDDQVCILFVRILVRHYADVAGGQVVFVFRFAFDIYSVVQLHSRAVAKVAGVLQTVVQSSYVVIVAFRIFVNDAGDTVFTV